MKYTAVVKFSGTYEMEGDAPTQADAEYHVDEKFYRLFLGTPLASTAIHTEIDVTMERDATPVAGDVSA